MRELFGKLKAIYRISATVYDITVATLTRRRSRGHERSGESRF